MNVPDDTKKRLASLDILRGFDLFLLLFFQPVLISIGNAANAPWLNRILYQFDHETWHGFRLWDIVMPLFLFMVGTSMPFSFAKYTAHGFDRKIYLKILRRFLILFLFGMIVQGNLLAFDPQHIYIYTNTLQAIAVGYLIASMMLLHLKPKGQLLATLVLLIIYSIPMALCGDYTPEGNFAYHVDRVIIGRFRGDLSYTWVWSSLTFGVTVMMGAFAGQMMKHSSDKKRTALMLAGTGIILILAGVIWDMCGMPINKRLWTASMTLYSGGICFMLMSLSYYIIDCRGYTYGLEWLKIYGMNAITAYILGEVINFRSIVISVSYGLEPLLGDYYNAWLTFGNFLILFLILRLMYRRGIYLKI